jgi:sulfur-oxidizing protein SoxX
VIHRHNSGFRTPSPNPSPLWGEGAVCRRPRFSRVQRAFDSLRVFASRRAFRSRLPLPRGERDGVRGLGRFGLRTTALAVAILASSARAELVAYKISGDAIPASLTGGQGDAARGRAIVANHNTGLCLLCHSGPFPEDKFQGTMAPDLAGAGARWSEGQLRLRIVDASKFNPQTIMPPFYRIDHLVRVPPAYRGKPVLTAVEVEDVIAYLMTLK